MKAIALLLYTFLTVGHIFDQEDKNGLVTICWDTSLSMESRDIEKEFTFLENYFSKKKDASVRLLVFKNSIVDSQSFLVESGNWNLIKNKLKSLSYDGATSYQELASYIEGGDVLLFSDGKQNSNIANAKFDGNLYIINSMPQSNNANFNLLRIINNGEYINLTQGVEKGSENGIEDMYRGSVYGANFGVEKITIKRKGSEKAVNPNENGFYSIHAQVGDILTFTTPQGLKTEKILGENRFINVWIEEDNGIRLDEVVVVKKREKYVKTITTGYGEENADKVGYAVQSISEDDISPINTTVSSAVQGKFSGVSLGQNDDLSQAQIRPKNSILGNNYGLIVIDGVPMPRSNSAATGEIQGTGFVDPSNIASIRVLKGLAATNRYGSAGSNGVLLIKTKTGTFRNANEKVDLALVKDNIYKGGLNINNKQLVTPYLKELKKGKNVERAYEIYLSQRVRYLNHPEYFIDVSNFFTNSSIPLAIQILSNILEKESPELSELLAMMYKANELKNYDIALEAAERLLQKYPNRAQSYLDMALAHKKVGNYQIALNMLNNIASGKMSVDLDFSGLKKIIDLEIRNLVFEKGKELDITKVDGGLLNNIRYNARLVFDWNNVDAQFEIQFVNPQKRFFKWSHTQEANLERIKDEITDGYNKEQFEIYGVETKGEWIINAKYLGNRNPDNREPTFFNCLVQYNFGKPNQRTEEYLVRLNEKGEEKMLVKLVVD